MPPLPGTIPPLPRGEPTPIPVARAADPAWLAFLLLPLRIAVFPLRFFRRTWRGPSPLLPTTLMRPRPPLPWWILGRWWFWVGFGLLVAFFNNSARDERRRNRENAARTVAEAPPVDKVAPVGPPGAPTNGPRENGPHEGPVSDEELQERVEQALGSSKLTREEGIDVEADEGAVTLSGEVKSPLVSHVAQALAETVAGVDKVHNQIKVEHGHPDVPAFWPDLSKVPFIGTRALDPASPEGKALLELLERAGQALAKGRPEEALGLFGAALSLDPKNKAAHDGLQEAGRRLGRHPPGLPPPPAAPSPSPPP